MVAENRRSPSQPARRRKVTVPDLIVLKEQGVRITALTAYDYPFAALVDAAGVDIVLVGDTASSVVHGNETTLSMTLEEMTMLLKTVRRGVSSSLLVADLPFGYCHGGASTPRTVEAAVSLVKAGAEAVKLEGGAKRVGLVRELVDAEVQVVAHIGLTPQAVHAMGGYRVQGKTARAADILVADAKALEEAGAFAVVLEGIPQEVAARITERLRIPTIGIGAGLGCDGQILVLHDMLGLTVPPPPEGPAQTAGKKPRFVREYLDLRTLVLDAIERYCSDVRSGEFPGPAETYRLSESESRSLQS